MFIACFIGGCAPGPERAEAMRATIRLGMSQTDVRDHLGNPVKTEKEVAKDGWTVHEKWYYHVQVQREQTPLVILEKGVVISIAIATALSGPNRDWDPVNYDRAIYEFTVCFDKNGIVQELSDVKRIK